MIHKETDNSSATGATGNEVAPLGINTLSSSPPVENGRAERYRLLSEARRIFCEQGKADKLEYPQNYHRTAKCIYSRFGEKVGINKSSQHKKTFYTGVIQCGSVFTCPVCAAKIQERRRKEISKAFDYAYNTLEKKVIMVTFTFPHSLSDDLKSLILKQREAFKMFRSGNVWQKKKIKVGFSGLIRSLEITHSDMNGFHPHTHEGWIVNQTTDVKSFREWLVQRWFKMCVKSGLVDGDYKKIANFFEHAVQITDWCSNSEYLAKMDDSKNWGIDRELAKGASKQAKGKGCHPFEFLSRSIDGCKRSKFLFLEYSNAMKRVRQIYWSTGLKKAVGVDELTDEEIAAQEEDKADVLGQLDKGQWNLVVKENAQAFVLDLAETSGIDGVFFWLGTRTNVNDLSVEVKTEQRVRMEKLSAKIKERVEYLKHSDSLRLQTKNSIIRRTLDYYRELSQDLSQF